MVVESSAVTTMETAFSPTAKATGTVGAEPDSGVPFTVTPAVFSDVVAPMGTLVKV